MQCAGRFMIVIVVAKLIQFNLQLINSTLVFRRMNKIALFRRVVVPADMC